MFSEKNFYSTQLSEKTEKECPTLVSGCVEIQNLFLIFFKKIGKLKVCK